MLCHTKGENVPLTTDAEKDLGTVSREVYNFKKFVSLLSISEKRCRAASHERLLKQIIHTFSLFVFAGPNTATLDVFK